MADPLEMRTRHKFHRLARNRRLRDRLRPTPVDIEVPGPDRGVELAECLARRGFPTATIELAGRWFVEIRSRQEPRALVAELSAAVESWLVEHALPALELRRGEQRITVGPVR
jgi:hypothetical protein